MDSALWIPISWLGVHWDVCAAVHWSCLPHFLSFGFGAHEVTSRLDPQYIYIYKRLYEFILRGDIRGYYMLTLIWYLDITDRKCFWEPWGTSNRPIVLATWGTAGTARSIRYFWFTSHGQSQEVARCREHCSWTLLVANQSCSIVLAIILRCHATILLVDLIVWLVQFLYLLDSWPYNVASPIQKLVSDPSIARYIYIYM